MRWGFCLLKGKHPAIGAIGGNGKRVSRLKYEVLFFIGGGQEMGCEYDCDWCFTGLGFWVHTLPFC